MNISAIRGDFLREKIDKNGCCGAAELIKLSSYLLNSYDFVLHLDADTFFTGASIYELFTDIIINKNSNKSNKDANHVHKKVNEINDPDGKYYSLIYTTDPNMATFKKGSDKMPVQGGFIMFKPSISDYDNVVDIVLNTEFHKGRGWNRSMIGWYWGGMTIQGVLPYYYNKVSNPNRTRIIDRCMYNTMADTKECTDVTPNSAMNTLSGGDILSAHFTVCQKPWTCSIRYWRNHLNDFNGMLCRDLHERYSM